MLVALICLPDAYPALLTRRPIGRNAQHSVGDFDMPKISKTLVDGARPDASDVFIWDDELRGFGLRVKPSGVKSYVLQFRNAHGRSRRLTLGRHGPLTPSKARELAKARLGERDAGRDPAEERKAARAAPSVAEFSERYLAHHAETKKKPRSIAEDRRLFAKHILPAFGGRKLADVTRSDVVNLHQRMADTPFQANRVLALLSKVMNLAEAWGERPDHSNPCRHVGKYRETKRERFLAPAELARLAEVLAEAERTATEPASVIAAVRLLVFTGCRLSEILTLRWEHVDHDGARLCLPDSKVGKKVVHLNAPALAVLAAVDREDGNPWVIRGRSAGLPLVNLEKPWRRIRAAAGLDDVRLHDLRHSFASVAVAMGEGLPMIGKLLGHTQAQTTHRYAHLAADPVKAATERVGAALSGMMRGERADVVPLKRTKS